MNVPVTSISLAISSPLRVIPQRTEWSADSLCFGTTPWYAAYAPGDVKRSISMIMEFSTCLMVTAEQLNRRQLCRTYAHASSDLSDLRRRIRSYILARGIAVSVPGRDIVSEATLRELDKVADSSMRLLIDEARHQRDRMRRIKNEIAPTLCNHDNPSS